MSKAAQPTPAAKQRRYRDYAWVVLVTPIKCPLRGVTADNFPAKNFAFFVEDGFFCIECKANGIVVETAPANIREARRKTEAELEAERKAEEERAVADAALQLQA